MKKTALLLAAACVASQGVAHALGVTPYLPLNLDPEVEYQVERVLILGDEPVMTRPIPAAMVLDALPKACKVDRPLCESVGHYLDRYMHTTGVEFTSVSAAATSGSSKTVLPNQHGEKAQSPYEVAGAAYVQPNSYMLLNVGGVAYQGRATPTGTMLSLGFDWAQLDIGWRDHWWSPMTDSAMLISTEAPTMPSITLSNYRPLTRLGFQYEAFVARMSESDRIELPLTGTNAPVFTRGYPKFGGIRVGIEPVSGWALSAQRVIIWGGGAAGGQSFTDILKALFHPGAAQTTGFADPDSAIGKQEASVTSRFIFPARVPFSVYFEYAGNDTLAGHSPLIGKPDISAGIDFPRIGPFSLTYEISSFAPTWYVHTASTVQTGYLDGLTNYGANLGNWFGDQRVLASPTTAPDEVGGQSNMLRLGWDPSFGGLMQLQLRALANENGTLFGTYSYKNEYLESLSYSYPWKGYSVGAELDEGRDVFGARYTRLEGYLRDGAAFLGGDDDSQTAAFAGSRPEGDELYVSAGADYYRTLINLHLVAYPAHYTQWTAGPYIALGARRRVSTHQDLGVAVEADDISGRTLVSFRMLDYRYRLNWPLAFNAFVGASRYSLGTPAYGLYAGGGLQWRNVLPGWDVGLDYRSVLYAQRERDLPTDPTPLGTAKPDSLTSIYSWTLYVSRKF